MTTIHNPSQFNPTDYSVIDYIDAGEIAAIWSGYNQLAASSREMGDLAVTDLRSAYAAAEADEKAVRDKYEQYFGVRSCPTQCQHCGTGRARYFAVAFHKPTAKHIAVGHICADNRLGLTLDQYKFDRLKERAAAIRTEQKRDAALAQLAETDPELADAIDAANRDGRYEAAAIQREQFLLGADLDNEMAAAVAQVFQRGIRFVADIAASLRGRDYSATDKQRAVILAGLDKSREFAALAVQRIRDQRSVNLSLADLAPLAGRVTLTGKIVSMKEYDGDYGISRKYLIVLTDGRKSFGSLPADLGWNLILGSAVEFVATVEATTDAAFYRHSRPTLTKAAKAQRKADSAQS
jgi:hypothetical protein